MPPYDIPFRRVFRTTARHGAAPERDDADYFPPEPFPNFVCGYDGLENDFETRVEIEFLSQPTTAGDKLVVEFRRTGGLERLTLQAASGPDFNALATDAETPRKDLRVVYDVAAGDTIYVARVLDDEWNIVADGHLILTGMAAA